MLYLKKLNELRLLLQTQQRGNYVLYVGELSAPGLYSLKTLFFSERPLAPAPVIGNANGGDVNVNPWGPHRCSTCTGTVQAVFIRCTKHYINTYTALYGTAMPVPVIGGTGTSIANPWGPHSHRYNTV
jgi:hypothetical protein